MAIERITSRQVLVGIVSLADFARTTAPRRAGAVTAEARRVTPYIWRLRSARNGFCTVPSP